MPIIGIILIIIGIVLIVMRLGYLKKIREMKYVETIQVKSVQENYKKISGELGKGSYTEYVELKGSCASKEPLKSQHTNTECIWYKSTITREYEEERWETDSDGKRNRETISGSDNVSTVENCIPFELNDGTGSITIDPSGASMVSKQIYSEFKPGEYNGSHRINLGGIVGGTSGRRTIGYRYEEEAIPVNQNLYILGEATDKDGSLEVKLPNDKTREFIISLKSQDELLSSYTKTAKGMLVGAIVLFVVGIIFVIL